MPTFTERVAGVYRCRFVQVREVEWTDQNTGELIQRWSWEFQEVDKAGSDGQIDRLTDRKLTKNSNALKFFTGLLGRKPQNGDDTDREKGALVDVVYGPNQAGNLAITDVIRVPEATTTAAAPAAPVATPEVAELP